LFLVLLLVVLAVAAAGCGAAPETPAATGEGPQEPAPEQAAAAPSPLFEVTPLTEQASAHGHWNFFAEQVAITASGEGHYNDACIECHSAVKRLDDHEAVLADFMPGGKYENQQEGITCRVCHQFGGEIGFELRAEDRVAVCADCHSGEPVDGKFNLNTAVHHPQGEMFKGIGGYNADVTPAFKMETMGFACFDCHYTNNVDHDFSAPTAAEIAANPSCSSCHTSEEQIAGQMEEIAGQTAERLEAIKSRIEAGKAKYEGAPADAQEAYGIAVTNSSFVEADASMGIHNPAYVTKLLDAAEAGLDQFEAAVM